MAIDPHFIPAFSIETVILDKDTGAPLSGGQVTFYEDNQRGILKPVYQITGNSPAYSYTELTQPLTLSSIGTFEDSLGNPVVPYFYPYVKNQETGQLDIQLYYVVVESFFGVQQFVREAVPYIPEGGDTSVSSILTNDISNPQFAQVLFDTTTNPTYTYSFMGVTDEVVHLAPDWDLIVTCPTSGSVTVSQLAPTGTDLIITNPATLLTISSAGISSLILRQRLYGSPNLWGQTDISQNAYISASFVAKTYNGADASLVLYYSQSSGTVIDQIIVDATLPSSGAYDAYPGVLKLPISDNTQNFPGAYIDIFFQLPLSIKIDITSVIVTGTGADPIDNIIYDQVPVARQIDQLYHYSYPIVPIGTIIDYFGFNIPLHYLLCDYTPYNRINYSSLFRAITNTETVTLTISVATFTVANGALYRIGMGVEGIGIPNGTTITGISTNTITMSIAATATGSVPVIFYAAAHVFQETVSLTNTVNTFTVANGALYKVNEAISGTGIPAATVITIISGNTITMSHPASATVSSVVSFFDPGNGDGSTTFNVPYLLGYVTAGTKGAIFGSNMNALGAQGGAPTVTLTANNLPPHTHPAPNSANFITTGPVPTYASGNQQWNATNANTGNNVTSNTPVSIVQSTVLVNKCIRFE